MTYPANKVFTSMATSVAMRDNVLYFVLRIPVNNNGLWWCNTVTTSAMWSQQRDMKHVVHPAQAVAQIQLACYGSDQLYHTKRANKTSLELSAPLQVQIASVQQHRISHSICNITTMLVSLLSHPGLCELQAFACGFNQCSGAASRPELTPEPVSTTDRVPGHGRREAADD